MNKKKILLVMLFTLMIAGCSQHIPKNTLAVQRSKINVSTYNETAHLRPIWNTREIYDQTVLFVEPFSSCTLIYPPTKIISVKNSALAKEYIEGVDYIIQGNKIYRLANSSIPSISSYDIFNTDKNGFKVINPGKFSMCGVTDSYYMSYEECSSGRMSKFVDSSISVSYEHNCENVFSIPKDQSDKAKKMFERLSNNEELNILFYGDSITLGCSASANYNCKPFVSSWPNIVYEYLVKYFSNTNSHQINTAIGGISTTVGQEKYKQLVEPYNADILFIAFGMNDEGTLENYKTKISQMCTWFLESNPYGLIILISPMVPNMIVFKEDCIQLSLETALWEISEANDNIICAPVTTLFKELLQQGISSMDYLANNINHPNDFGTRLYAQVILKSLMGDRFFKESWEY